MEMTSYVTGLVDGEGCFSVSFSLRNKMKYGIEVRPSFSVSQHKRNKEIILFLQHFFKCGGVRFSKRDQNYKFEVRSISDLVKYIIPHFEQYPLHTSKQRDFETFKVVCKLIQNNQHLSRDGIKKVIILASYMNEAGQRKYSAERLLKMVSKMKV
ncbi:MAG: LAGLIDADG family homing endonuclease [Candidatus Kerfeldbacteria bacterium]|nr:LAGLIDADG family homing endonuclease [Candidatus Kerfeldbacteria bacterium]